MLPHLAEKKTLGDYHADLTKCEKKSKYHAERENIPSLLQVAKLT